MTEFLTAKLPTGFMPYTLWVLWALIALIAIWLVWKLFRIIQRPRAASGRRSKAARLAVTDAAAIDPHRRLVLVRRDDVEHLIMIGGPQDLVIEQEIRRHAPAQAKAPITAPQPAPPAPAPTLAPVQTTTQPAAKVVATPAPSPVPTAPSAAPTPAATLGAAAGAIGGTAAAAVASAQTQATEKVVDGMDKASELFAQSPTSETTKAAPEPKIATEPTSTASDDINALLEDISATKDS